LRLSVINKTATSRRSKLYHYDFNNVPAPDGCPGSISKVFRSWK